MSLSSKASARISLNRSLLGIILTAFFLTININKEIFFQKILILQLVISIPLFLFSMLAYSKIGYRKETGHWNFFAYSTFTLGYSFTTNVVGILIGEYIAKEIALIFFALTWVLALIYSALDISFDRSVLKERIAKDSILLITQFVLGVLVVMDIVNY